ncbi:MAG TPA: NUDIX hydrolase [Polyangiaceae bacterium]|nr:NUDIX hydrolase [Polyangiaceae bacterium]
MKLGALALGASTLVREVARHVLRRPVIGVAAAARTEDDRWLLVRRADSGDWALPGGTLEWGETLERGILRELAEEAGVDEVVLGRLVGAYSRPERDPRFHAVTVVVEARIAPPVRPPINPVEILEARLFARSELPRSLSHGMGIMLEDALAGATRFE